MMLTSESNEKYDGDSPFDLKSVSTDQDEYQTMNGGYGINARSVFGQYPFAPIDKRFRLFVLKGLVLAR
jgi:hypothetical protein